MRYSENFVANNARRFHTAGARFFHLESVPGGIVSVLFFKDRTPLPEEIVASSGGWWASFGGPGQSASFDEVEIISTVTQQVIFHLSRGGVGSNVFSGAVSVNKPTTIDTIADVNLGAGATSVVPADATRRAALITNLAANLNNMRVGDANVGAARGAEIQPGQTITLEGTEEIFVFGTQNDDVGITLIKD